MPNLWKFISKADREGPKIEEYHYEEAKDLFLPLEMDSELLADAEPFDANREDVPIEEEPKDDPVSFAQVQSELILRGAKQQAEEILALAEQQAQELMEQARRKAEEEGYEAGFQKGVADGLAQSLEENARAREQVAIRLENEIAEFLDKAQLALEAQLDQNLGELRDLALAVAEKIVCVSLKSSSEVIGKMIQTAVDKRRHREWVHIYVAECDARKLAQMPDSLMTALSALSDRVRIVPMADDEPGTCIIEMPDEIVDASASTQLNNIKNMLADTPLTGRETVFRRRSEDHVPTYDTSGLQR